MAAWLLAGGSALASGPALNGVSLTEISAAQELRGAPVAGELYVLKVGLREHARSLTRGETLHDLFAHSGWNYISNIGPDAALLQATVNGALPFPELVPLAREWRISGDVQSLRGTRSDEEIALIVHYAGDELDASSTLMRALPTGATFTGTAAKGHTRSNSPLTRAGMRLAASQVDGLLQNLLEDPRVISVERGGGAKFFNDTARRIVQSGTTSTGGETIWAQGIYGEGQIIALVDSGADPLNCYLAESDASFPPVMDRGVTGTPDYSRRKIVAYDMLYALDDPSDGRTAYDNHGHGTLVSGNATGSRLGDTFSAADNIYNGAAPGAQLIVQDGGFTTLDSCSDMVGLGCPVLDLTDVLEQAYAQGARIHNNSWGDREEISPQNIYSPISADFDDMTWRNPEFLGVCAAGNSGGAGTNPESVGSPSTGKNVLSIAGTENPSFQNIVWFSSIGWTEDGRIKPDLAAPAQTITSALDLSSLGAHCDPTDSLAFVQGTSMASPIASGSAALVRQYFEDGFYPSGTQVMADGFSPSAALVKAVMIAGAQPVASEPPPPSPRQGWGRINLEESLYFDGDSQGLIAADNAGTFNTTGESFSQVYTVNEDVTDDIVIVLAWSDAPGASFADPALVNDLNLTVTFDPTGTRGTPQVYLGNIFDMSGASITGGSADSVNNIEVVKIPANMNGTYTITVDAENILEPGQPFSLVLNGPGAIGESSINSWVIY